MNRLVRSISIVGALLVFTFFMIAGFLTYRSQVNLQHSRDLVIKTTDLIIQLKSVISTLKDCETGQRGYVITGDPSYLEPYEKCHSTVYGLIDKLEVLINGDVEDHKQAQKLRELSGIKLAELRQTIELRRESGFEAASKIVITNSGKNTMDEIRSIVADMEKKQEALLQERLKILDAESSISRVYSLVLIGMGCLFLAGTLLLINTLVAKREKIQQALVERELTLSTILDTAAEGIFSVSDEGIIESVNAAICNIFAYEANDLIGKHVRVILPKFLDLISEFANKNKEGVDIADRSYRTDIEILGVKRNGSELIAEVSYSIINLRGKDIISIMLRDATERKAMERRVSEFYSTVSHELRTPLTSIRGSLSLMDGGRAGELSPRAQQLIKVARSEAERLIRLINDILDIKKIESGKLELKLEPIEVKDLIKQAIEGLYGYAEQTGIKLSMQLNTMGTICCDKDRVDQILSNLISNAIKFSSSGEEVIVKVDKTHSDSWRFSVTDSGSGIAEAEIPKLFGLFQQLDPSDSRRKGGTGLGLAICKALVEKHKGIIGVDSKVGQGSTFWFELPDIEAKVEFNVPKYRPTLVYKTTGTVLIVEDDHKLANLLAMMLEDQNFIAVKSGSIKEAEEYLQTKGNPDAIILDLTLPDGDGLALMERLEQKGKASVPVIIVSGREPDLNSYPYPLLIDWIKKPFDEKQLLSALALAMKKRPSGKARVLIVEDDQATREVIKQNLEPLDVDFIEASDGVTAVYFAKSKNPDLILLDLGLPSLDGFEVVQILRKEKIQDTPLIVYTARDLSENDKKELTLGLTSHMTKSRTSEEELIEMVKTMLNGLVDRAKTLV